MWILTRVPGINVLTAQTLLAKIGPDFSHFPSGPELASWLGLCSDNRVSGGKVLSVKTRKVKNRAATAQRMAALSLDRSQSFLGHFYRRMRTKLGAPKAITATAHKLARIIYHMVTTDIPTTRRSARRTKCRIANVWKPDSESKPASSDYSLLPYNSAKFLRSRIP